MLKGGAGFDEMPYNCSLEVHHLEAYIGTPEVAKKHLGHVQPSSHPGYKFEIRCTIMPLGRIFLQKIKKKIPDFTPPFLFVYVTFVGLFSDIFFPPMVVHLRVKRLIARGG